MSRKLVDDYAAGGKKLAPAIVGLSQEELNAFPVAGTWSIQQIVLHVVDSDVIATDRMKWVIAEDNPTLMAFDESAFARALHYDKQDAATACEVFAKNRQLTTALLRALPDEAFKRTGNHTERGVITLADIIDYMVKHIDHHLKFIYEKRRLLGKPLE